MYAFQSSFEHKKEDTLSDLKLHYHNYDRKYDNSGYLDEYYSQAIVARGEREIKKNEKLSFGYGAEYKYDWEILKIEVLIPLQLRVILRILGHLQILLINWTKIKFFHFF